MKNKIYIFYYLNFKFIIKKNKFIKWKVYINNNLIIKKKWKN